MTTAGLAAVTALLLLAQGGWAQSDQDALEAARACSTIADDAERLACLDAALEATAASDESVAPADDGATVAGRADASAAESPVAQPPEAAALPVAEETPAPVPQAPPATRRTVQTTDTETASPEAAEESEVTDEVERNVTIVEIRRSSLGVATFITEDGETWVERSRSNIRFPQVPFDAVLQPAMGDSYFLSSAVGRSRARVVPVR